MPVDTIVEDPLARVVIRTDPIDQRIESAPCVEHHRPQLTLNVRRELNPGFLVPELTESERVGETTRRINGEHQDPTSLLGGRQPESGRRGRLADTAGAHADDQALFFNQGGQTHESPPLRVSVSMRLRSAFAIC